MIVLAVAIDHGQCKVRGPQIRRPENQSRLINILSGGDQGLRILVYKLVYILKRLSAKAKLKSVVKQPPIEICASFRPAQKSPNSRGATPTDHLYLIFQGEGGRRHVLYIYTSLTLDQPPVLCS